MAKLNIEQAERQVEREKQKQKEIKKKQDIQVLKEALGEEWKKTLRDNLQKEIENNIGSENSPKIYDSIDLYDLFDPIIIYKDKENKELNLDLEKFLEVEKEYSEAIESINKQLQKDNKDINIDKDSKQSNKNKQLESLINNLSSDGVNEEDDILPYDLNLESGEVHVDQYGNILEDEEENKKNNKNPISVAKAQLNKTASKFFNRFIPVYNKYVCDCCGVSKNLNEYYIIYSVVNSGRVDNKGNRYMSICKACANKLFMYHYTVNNKNIETAMKNTCADLNLYWDLNMLSLAKEEYEEGNRKGSLLGAYIKILNKKFPGLTFVNSPFLQENYEIPVRVENRYDAPLDWSEQDAKNKKDIIHILGYDPFEYEENEDDKKILYADLISIIDEDIQQDYVKLQSALTIVKSFTKVRKLDEKAYDMEQSDASLAEQKSIADLKAKELKAISDFSRDSGFSERFKTKQSQGSTSFTGIMKTMNEKKYENELINKYDVQTSATIQAAADASFKAIFNQLNLSEAEAYKIAAEQLEELRKIKRQNEKLEEDLRQAKYEIAELKLKEKAYLNGVEVGDEY